MSRRSGDESFKSSDGWRSLSHSLKRNPPAPASHAPSPAHAPAQGGGMLSGIGSTIAQGTALAFRTANKMAHRALDAVPEVTERELQREY